MKYSYSIALLAVSLVRAQECSLKGVAVSDSGSPVPGVEVSIMNFSFRHPSPRRTATTAEDGSFSFTGLTCGKYSVTALTSDIGSQFPGMLAVDVKKQPSIQLKIPNVDPLASLLYVGPRKQPQPLETNANPPTRVPAASEDPAIAARRRAYFAQLNPAHLGAFDAAPLPEKKQMYAAAVATRMAGLAGGDSPSAPQEQENGRRRRSPFGKSGRVIGGGSEAAGAYVAHSEEDQAARRQLAHAAAIVRENLSPGDAAGFDRAPEIDRARIFLRAAAALPARHEPGCGMFGLMITDMEGSGGEMSMGYMVNNILDDPTAGRWETLDIPGRCALLDRVAAKELEMAKTLAADGSIETVKSVIARTGSERGPRSTVLEVFGKDGLNRYDQARGTDGKLELFRAALLMNLCWAVAYVAM